MKIAVWYCIKIWHVNAVIVTQSLEATHCIFVRFDIEIAVIDHRELTCAC